MHDLANQHATLILKAFSQSFIQVGVQEQFWRPAAGNFSSKIPFIATYAMFCPGRAWEQVHQHCLNNVKVNIIGDHAGVSVSRMAPLISHRRYCHYARYSQYHHHCVYDAINQKNALLGDYQAHAIFVWQKNQSSLPPKRRSKLAERKFIAKAMMRP